jgi:toxin FitB
VIILDTNVVSALMRGRPLNPISQWIAQSSWSDLFLTAITEAELFFGAERLARGKQRRELEIKLEQLFQRDFRGRVLSFDSAAARNFAEIAALRKQIGRPSQYPDMQIAAIARSRGAALATRNVADFEHCGIKVIDPWTA